MTCRRFIRIMSIITLLFVLVALSSSIASAQTKLEGVIKGRNGAQIIL